MPDIKTLKTFRSVARYGSFYSAAHALSVSVSTISLQMRNLEDFSGMLLFDRSKKPPPLTDDGHDYLTQVEAVLSAWDRLEKMGSSDEGNGRLRLGAVHTSLAHIIPQALNAIRDHYPKLQVNVHLGLSHELEKMLRSGHLDIALLTTPDDESNDLSYHHIIDEKFVLIKAKGLAGDDAETCLAENPIVRFSPKARVGEMIDALISKVKRKSTLQPDMEIDTLESVIALVQNGLGVAIIPLIEGARHLDDVDVLPLDQQAFRKISLAVPRLGPQVNLTENLASIFRKAAG